MADPAAPNAAAPERSVGVRAVARPIGRPKVVYVMGAGHSGSTILGVTLGNCDGFFFAGELEEWLLRSGVPRFGGTGPTRFWREVRARVRGSDLFGNDVVEAIERSGSWLRVNRWPARRRLRGRYRQVAEELYRGVAEVAGAEHVVDTSHFPLRAREMRRVKGIDLYLVFLVRDPQSVIGSYADSINRHAVVERAVRILDKNIDLWLTHILAVLVFLRHPRDRRLFVRHEQFIADPEGVLRQILDLVGADTAIPDLTSLSTGYPIQGNRLLWLDVVALKSKPAAPARGSRITQMLQLPLAGVLRRMRPAAGSTPHE